MTAAELRSSQGLEALTAILGCSLCLPGLDLLGSPQTATASAHEQQAMCLCLLYAVNWMRELVNGFSVVSSR